MTAVLAEVEQLGQRVEAATALEEVVGKQLAGARSRLDVHTQADGEEGLELLGELVWLLEAGCTVGGDEIESLERLLVKVWRFRLNHFNRHNTQRPNIYLVAVLLLLNNLGRHPVRCSHHGRTLVARLGQLGAETKIGYASISTGTSLEWAG